MYFYGNRVESLAIYSDGGTLTDEGVGVDTLDEAEYMQALALLGEQADNLGGFACPITVSVEYCHCMFGSARNGMGNLLVFL